MDAALKEAKEKSLKKDKSGALLALKRKKLFESEIHKLQGARITMVCCAVSFIIYNKGWIYKVVKLCQDSQVLALESAAVNIETFRAMKAGANAMKGIRGNLDSDKVDDMMEEIQEEREIHDAISEAISRPGQVSFPKFDIFHLISMLLWSL